MTTRQTIFRRPLWLPAPEARASLSADVDLKAPAIWTVASRPGLLVLQWIGIRRRADAAADTMPYVQGMDGPYSGRRLPLDADLVFGRDPKSCNVVFSRHDDGISARHCSLRFLALKNSFELRDLGSSNGTFVDGKRVDPSYAVLLRDGEEFHLFKSRYRFAVRLGAAGENASAR